MSNNMNIRELNDFEDSLIARFNSHPVLADVNQLSDARFRELLLQKRFVSLAFTPMYDVAIGALTDPDAIGICREILCEEYQPNLPSHREDLFADLLALGATRDEILSSTPTLETSEVLRELFSMLVLGDRQREFFELRALTLLRFWGEVTVSEEYGRFVPRMERMGLNEQNSRFYWPHWTHDRKSAALHEPVAEGSHSDLLTKVLQRQLSTPERIRFCAEVEQRVFDLKTRFFDQFRQAGVFSRV